LSLIGSSPMHVVGDNHAHSEPSFGNPASVALHR